MGCGEIARRLPEGPTRARAEIVRTAGTGETITKGWGVMHGHKFEVEEVLRQMTGSLA